MNRPPAVTIFGILNIIFAIFGILAIASTVRFFTAGADPQNPVVQAVREYPVYAAWLTISIGIGLPISGMLMATGVGLLQLKPWARKASIAYGIYAVVMVLIRTAMNFKYLTLPLIQQAHQQQGAQAASAMSQAMSGALHNCIGFVYPALLILFMYRPKVVAALAPRKN